MTTQSLADALADRQIQELIGTLQSEHVMTPGAFENHAEQALKETVSSGLAEGPVAYETILDEHGDLIGSTDRETRTLPWWLRDFVWTVDTGGSDQIELTLDNPESLSRFEDFPKGDTRVADITLRDNHQFKQVLTALQELKQALTDEADQEIVNEADHATIRSFPNEDRLFDSPYGENKLETHREFGEWLSDLLGLFPPENDATTGLLIALTNVRHGHAKNVLPDEALAQFDRLGLVDEDDRIFNQRYYDALKTLLEFSGVFDQHVSVDPPEELDVQTDQYDDGEMSPLQYAFHDAWASANQPVSGADEWFGRVGNSLDPEEESRFADVAFETPLWIRSSKSSVQFQPWKKTYFADNRDQLHTLLDKRNHPVNE
jgi:hypothetical protein